MLDSLYTSCVTSKFEKLVLDFGRPTESISKNSAQPMAQ